MNPLEIFQYAFMVRAFAAGILIGFLAPLIGMFLVVRRYSLLADTLSHVSLIGVAIGLLTGINPIMGAMAAAVIAAVGMEELRSTQRIFGEAVLALFLSGSLAIAVILISLSHGSSVNFFSYLFGSITTVLPADLVIIAVCAGVTALAVALGYRQLFLISLDEELAQANGIAVKRYNIMLTIAAAITVSVAMHIVGVLLVGALMVIPVITAMQYRRSFVMTHVIAVAMSLAATVIGLYLAYYLDIPSGAAIVATSLIFFIATMAVSRRRVA